jgi:hypothetical protein
MRSRAPRTNAKNRNATFYRIPSIELEGDLVAPFVARRYRIALPVARAIVVLASLGRAFG